MKFLCPQCSTPLREAVGLVDGLVCVVCKRGFPLSSLVAPLNLDDVAEHGTRGDAMAEKELQRLCEQELSRRGVEYLHLSHRAREARGWPDLTFVIVGTPYAVELKTATGKLSAEQDKTLRRMAANGWRTSICRSFDEFRNAIDSQR